MKLDLYIKPVAKIRGSRLEVGERKAHEVTVEKCYS